LWRSRWLTDAIEAQTRHPDELLVAVDHTDDDTVDVLVSWWNERRRPFPLTILEVLAPRPEPYPASGIADNCLFHAAHGDILIHLDDDCRPGPDFLELNSWWFQNSPRCIIFHPITFTDRHFSPIDPPNHTDSRLRCRRYHLWPRLPGGLAELPATEQLCWGAAWTVRRADVAAIGGHDLTTCGYHNTDTRLGKRLTRSGVRPLLATDPRAEILHLGQTWHVQNQHNTTLIAKYSWRFSTPKVANGGPKFWSSPWFQNAYRKTHTLTP